MAETDGKSESYIRNEIALALGRKPNVLIMRINVGKARALNDPTTIINFGPPPGTADLIACISGRFVGIEVKTTIGRQSEQQKSFERALTARNGIYILARSVEDVVIALRHHGLWQD